VSWARDRELEEAPHGERTHTSQFRVVVDGIEPADDARERVNAAIQKAAVAELEAA